MEPLRVFIGYDPAESVAYSVLCHSIMVRASVPVSITPLKLSQLSEIYHRPRNPLQSTEFSFSRFLTPYLSQYQGWSLFMDCDMVMLTDIAALFALADDRYAVMVCKHDYQPQEEVKFLNNIQTKYVKKNWSSFMLFNNKRCQSLNLDYVNQASGLELHQFKWLEDDELIGSLPLDWNYLVGVYPKIQPEKVKNLHYTIGGPYFDAFKSCDYADIWWEEYRRATFAEDNFEKLARAFFNQKS